MLKKEVKKVRYSKADWDNVVNSPKKVPGLTNNFKLSKQSKALAALYCNGSRGLFKKIIRMCCSAELASQRGHAEFMKNKGPNQ